MKYDLTFRIVENCVIAKGFALMKLTPADNQNLPDMQPGQFVEVEVPDSTHTFLRRPISINFVDYDKRQLWLLIRIAGEGTAHLAAMPAGASLKILLPLGHGFTVNPCLRTLLVGGGVGVAPLLYLAHRLNRSGVRPDLLLGVRSADMLLEVELFQEVANVFIATDDGSAGHHGIVTTHPALTDGQYDFVACCGPQPMMRAVATVARQRGINCEVSLENMMACGLGACLCCVENTVDGHQCVCTEGPVFNIEKLRWHNI